MKQFRKGELGEIRFFFNILILQNKDSCSAAPGMCSAIVGLYGNSRNKKKIEGSKIFYDPKPFSLDQGYTI